MNNKTMDARNSPHETPCTTASEAALKQEHPSYQEQLDAYLKGEWGIRALVERWFTVCTPLVIELQQETH